MRVKINSEVVNGRLVRNRSLLSSAFKQFEGKCITISIEREKKQRSTPQNAFYYGVVIPLVIVGLKDATGDVYNSTQVHDLLKHRFLSDEVHLGGGQYMERIKSSTELSTIEWEEFIENIRQFAQEFLNVKVGEPNENLSFEM